MIQAIIAAHDLYKFFGHPIQIFFFSRILKAFGPKDFEISKVG
jgi:hypothetical protein